MTDTLAALFAPAVLLALSLGWHVGHRTARVVRIPVGAAAAEDATAIALAGACCESWWTSTGTAHDAACATTRRAA
ncbi:MAG: hypothetical protein LBV60_01585 [Streptomyces sp.]|nr:hypothetical protein [Streptomyces sp.]